MSNPSGRKIWVLLSYLEDMFTAGKPAQKVPNISSSGFQPGVCERPINQNRDDECDQRPFMIRGVCEGVIKEFLLNRVKVPCL
jgi:hypothetical protein